jgi:hypothetical protein
LYICGIKIQTNIKQNSIIKYTRKSKIFLKIFFLKIFGTGPDPAQKKQTGLNKLHGWTQPSRVGWADVPTQKNKRPVAGYCAKHSNH